MSKERGTELQVCNNSTIILSNFLIRQYKNSLRYNEIKLTIEDNTYEITVSRSLGKCMSYSSATCRHLQRNTNRVEGDETLLILKS